MLSMIHHYGYAAVFVSMMLGVVGLPLPLEFLLLFAGSVATATKLSFVWFIAFAWLGATAGMTINYGLGKKIGIQRISKVTKWVHITEERLNRWAGRFQRSGPLLVVTGFFVAGLRHASPFIAGAGSMPYLRFIGYAAAGGLLWIGSFSFLGEKFGRHWHSLMRFMHHPVWLIGGAALILAVFVMKRRFFSSKSHVCDVK